MQPLRVDFYLLQENEPQHTWLVICRLIEKAYKRGHHIFVFCENQQDAEHLDELLWTFKEDSFIPHNLQGEGPEPAPAVQIGYGPEPRGFNDILINLANTVPNFLSRFKRAIEIVPANESAKSISRDHYRHYRGLQCDLHTHTI